MGSDNMLVSINFNSTDAAALEAMATQNQISVEDFTRRAVLKELRNAAYTAKLDRAFQNLKEGKWTQHELVEV